MRHVAAYLLARLGGIDNPTASDLEKIMGSVGVEANKEKLDRVLKELEDKSIEDIIASGKEKLATVGTSPSLVVNEAQYDTRNPVPTEILPPEPEETEESDDDLGFGLFD